MLGCHKLKAQDGVVGYAAQTGAPHRSDVGADAFLATDARDSLGGAPLKSQGTTFGIWS
jgi:hypothetical protein